MNIIQITQHGGLDNLGITYYDYCVIICQNTEEDENPT